MTPARVATVLVWAAILSPWLVVVPVGSAIVATLAATLAMLAALHGFGLALARGSRCTVDAALATAWGLAVVIAIGGAATLLGIFTRTAGIALAFAGIALHTLLLLREREARVAALASALRPHEARWWLPPVALVIALGALHVLGSAGDLAARPFDDETHHLAQLQRLWDTGALGDAVGFARESQLGGQLVVSSLASLLGHGAAIRWMDSGIGMVLVLVLVVARVRPRDAAEALWALAVVLVLSAAAFVAADPASCWIACGLLLALYTIDRTAWLPAGLLVGAAATLRHELIPVALAAALALERRGRVALVAAAVVAPLAIARVLAHAELPAAARALIEVDRITLPRIGLFVALVLILATVLVRLLGSAGRAAAYGTAAGIAGIASQLGGDRPYATRFLWPIMLAALAAYTILLARERLRATGVVVLLVLAALVVEGREARGRVRWSRRYAELAGSIAYLRTMDGAPARAGSYDALLARVPAGATVAAWVARPHELPYEHHRLVDLRTPRLARLRMAPWERGAGRLQRLLDALAPAYLLVEEDHEARARIDTTPGAWWCELLAEACSDDLERAAGYRELARDATVRLLIREP